MRLRADPPMTPNLTPTIHDKEFTMPTVPLDANTVRTAICPADKKKLDLYDAGIPGFVLEVRPSGGKTYYLRYRDAHGKQKQLRIGDATGISFEQAKAAVLTTRAKVILGDDPVAEKRTLRTIPTLEDFAHERYLPYVKGAKRSWDTDESFLRNHVLPRWGRLHLDEVKQQDVIEFHHALKARGYAPATANRVIILTRYMFNLARKWKIPGAEHNPAAGVTLFEENNKRERYLTKEEAQRLCQCLQDSDNPQLKFIVPLLLLTGVRKRELLDAQWSHFDLERRTWRIPLSKSGKARHVPLSDSVLAILAQLPRWEGCPYVVPNPKTKKPFVSFFYSWDTARNQAGLPEVRVHDLRHSFASFVINAANENGLGTRSIYELQVLLGHTQLKTTQRYSHLDPKTLLQAASVASVASGLTPQALGLGL